MIVLRQVDRRNFDACRRLERASNWFVGDADFVLAEAYLYREDSTAYAICLDDAVIGLVIVLDRPGEGDPYYSFTDLFIADSYLGKGWGKLAVQAVLDKFRAEKKRDTVEIQVHRANEIARNLYSSLGFEKIKVSDWDEDFEVMRLEL